MTKQIVMARTFEQELIARLEGQFDNLMDIRGIYLQGQIFMSKQDTVSFTDRINSMLGQVWLTGALDLDGQRRVLEHMIAYIAEECVTVDSDTELDLIRDKAKKIHKAAYSASAVQELAGIRKDIELLVSLDLISRRPARGLYEKIDSRLRLLGVVTA